MSQVHLDYRNRHSIYEYDYEYEYKHDDDIDVDLIEAEPIYENNSNASDYDDGSGVAFNKTRSKASLLAELSPMEQNRIHQEQLTILNQIRHEGSDYDELDSAISYGTNSSSTQSSAVSFISQYTDDVSDYNKNTTSRRQSVSFSKFMSLGFKGKLNRSRVSRHIRMLSELKIPAPEANEPILFESKVLKWYSSLSKKPSNNYLVLTKKCLCNFKNAEKAAKVFDGLPLTPHSSHFSGIYDDNFSSSLSSSEVISKNLPPESVIFSLATVYAISEQLTAESHVRVDYISGSKNHDYVSIVMEGPYKRHQWFENLRNAIQDVNPVGPYLTLNQRERLMDKLRSLDDLADEDENNFVAFRALLKSIIDSDFEKNPNIPIFFVLGRNNVYFIPYNLIGNDLSTDDDINDQKQHLQPLYYPLLFEHVKPKEIELHRFQYPLLCLTKIHSDENDDDLQLTFKNSIGSMERSLTITSLVTENIITDIRTAIDSITFWWPSPGYELDAPTSMQATIIPPERESDKTSHAIGFDRMLEAQCHTNRVNRSRISFNIEYVLGESIVFGLGVNHLPFRFILLPPNSTSQSDKHEYTYSNQELMAIFNSLKYHPLLHEIILRNTNLFELQIQPSGNKNHKRTNMLATVLYDLLLSNPRLKKLDLTSCGITSETVSAIGEAFMTGQSCLERLLLGNNSITREGIQALASGITGHKSAIKELDISNCKLNHGSIESILHALDTNDPDKLEVLDISNNRCDLESNILGELLSKTVSLRTLNLHNCAKLFVRTGPVISTEVLGNTQLTTLNLGGISLHNSEILESFYVYLQSPSFAKLQYLNVANCELDGEMVAIILSYVTTSPNHKKIRVWAGGNQIMKTSQGHKEFCNAIRNDWTPTWLSLKETRFGPNTEMIVDMIQAFSENSVIKYLDISYPKFRLRGDPPFSPQSLRTASKACEAIGNLFKENHSIKELELMGSEDRRFGPSLGPSLFELEENYTLEKLNIKGNSISDQGAKALSEALKSNTKLRNINCDENEIGIVGYSAIHNVFTQGLNTVVQQFTYPIQDIENFNEALDAKFAIQSRENLFSPKMSQKLAFEKQKNNLRQVIDEIMQTVEDIGSFEDHNYYNDDTYRSSSTGS